MAGLAYVSLEEAAELEGIKYNTLVQRIRRNTSSYDTKAETRDSGGKEMTLVAVNSLSKLGQNRWKEREKLKEMAETAADLPEEETKGQDPWYVNADYEWFEHQYKTKYYKATELGNVIRRFLKESESHRRDLTTFTEDFAQENLGKSGRTFRRMVKDYQQAEAWAAKLSKEDGCSYDHLMVLALCRKPKSCGLFPSIPADMKQAIKNIWFNEDFAVNRRTRQDLYEVLEEIAVNKGWKKLPSYQTVVRYISYLMDDENLRSAFEYQQKGIRKWKNENMVKRARDTKSLQVLEMLQGDEHMDKFYRECGGNAGRGNYEQAKSAGELIANTRSMIQDLLHCPTKQVVFEPTATIALNLIIQGNIERGAHNIYVSPFEHNAVTRVLHHFEKQEKIVVRQLTVGENLRYDMERIRYQFEEEKPDFVIVSHASNSFGVVALFLCEDGISFSDPRKCIPERPCN